MSQIQLINDDSFQTVVWDSLQPVPGERRQRFPPTDLDDRDFQVHSGTPVFPQ